MSSIDVMLKQAKETADTTPAPSQEVVVAESQITDTVVAETPKNFGLDDLDNGNMSVDDWLKVSDMGITTKEAGNTGIAETLKVEINLESIAVHEAMRISHPTFKVFKTYDGVTEANTKESWTQLKADCLTNFKDSVKIFTTADVPMTLLESIKDKKGKVLVEAGKVLGYTPPPSGVGKLSQMRKDVQKLGKDTAEVELSFEVGSKQGYKDWGILKYTVLK